MQRFTLILLVFVISLVSCSDNRNQTNDSQKVSQTNTDQKLATNSGRLTNEKAEKAINEWISSKPKGSAVAPAIVSGTAKVNGVQEIPQNNTAQVDVLFTDLMGPERPVAYSMSGIATFTHYNDGRWVLTSVIGKVAGGGWVWNDINIEAR